MRTRGTTNGSRPATVPGAGACRFATGAETLRPDSTTKVEDRAGSEDDGPAARAHSDAGGPGRSTASRCGCGVSAGPGLVCEPAKDQFGPGAFTPPQRERVAAYGVGVGAAVATGVPGGRPLGRAAGVGVGWGAGVVGCGPGPRAGVVG